MIVYKVTNILNGKVYVGLTKHSLNRRWQQHVARALKNPTCKFHLDIREFGQSNFKPEIIVMCENKQEGMLKERQFIHENNTVSKGYNTSNGSIKAIKDFVVKNISFKKSRVNLPRSFRSTMSEDAKQNMKKPKSYSCNAFVKGAKVEELVNKISFLSLRAAALHFNINSTSISRALKNNNGKCKNLVFKTIQ